MVRKHQRQKFFGRWRSIPTWAEVLARIGLAAKASVYLMLGVVALYDAFKKTSADSNPSGMMHLVGKAPMGYVVLGLLAAGLCCYGIHRCIEAFLGPVTARRWWLEAAQRCGRLIGGIVYLGLAGLALELLISSKHAHSSQTPALAAALMRHPLGNTTLVGIGVAIGLVGVKYGYDAVRRRYRGSYDLEGRARRVGWLVELGAIYGISARAILFFLGGWLACYAGMTSESSAADGMRGAVALIQTLPFGECWFAIIATGLCCYGLFSLLRSVYGVYPSDAGV